VHTYASVRVLRAQGWPKWASMVVYSTSDGGAAVGIYAPSVSTLPDGSTVDIDTSYPYEDEVRITLFPRSLYSLLSLVRYTSTHLTFARTKFARSLPHSFTFHLILHSLLDLFTFFIRSLRILHILLLPSLHFSLILRCALPWLPNPPCLCTFASLRGPRLAPPSMGSLLPTAQCSSFRVLLDPTLSRSSSRQRSR
jgi:hypothetical protein